MLDRATIERLSKAPETNAPMLNVALAEEGTVQVLFSLARCRAVGAEALSVIAARIAREGRDVGHDAEAVRLRDRRAEPEPPADEELDKLLIAHPKSDGVVRDEVLARHAQEPFFVLAAAAHPRATLTAICAAVDSPAASPLHDRLWLALIEPSCVPPLVLEEWAFGDDELRREAAARLTREGVMIDALAQDPARRVRRALASNRFAEAARKRLAEHDPALEVRARAEGALSAHGELGEGERIVDTARFAAALRCFSTGGVLAPDVARALATAPERLDPLGLIWAAQVLPRADVSALIGGILGGGVGHLSAALAAGLSLRRPHARGAPEELDPEELPALTYEALKTLSRTARDPGGVTGKARLAVWAADGLAPCDMLDPREMVGDLGCGALLGERLVLGRKARPGTALLRRLANVGRELPLVPAALVELAWADPGIDENVAKELAARVSPPKKRADDLPEDELDLEPSARPLDVLERAVLAATGRANVGARAALAVVALDSRRVRYVLAAMPSWKGRLSGGLLARVLRQNAGALSAAQAENRARVAKVEGWTTRVMSEIELGIALAVGHLTGEEIAKRFEAGRIAVDDGVALAAGAEARAAVEGPNGVLPLLAWAARRRAERPEALVLWLLLERLDRPRSAALVASAVDALVAGRGAVPSSVCEALAMLERRAPGRLEEMAPQSPKGRATIAAGVARAYRAVGGMRDERGEV